MPPCDQTIHTVADITACLTNAATSIADELICQQYPRAVTDGISCPAPELVCGNGITEPGEQCDPPDDTNCPGRCTADCQCPPALASLPDRSIPLGSTLTLQLAATDVDPLALLTFSLPQAPAGATVMPAGTGFLQWTPSAAQLGANVFTAQVQDASGLSDEKSFMVTVVPGPVLGPTLGPQADVTLPIGTRFSRTLTASDPDPEATLSYALVSGPAGMVLNGADLSWDTSGEQPGGNAVSVEVGDATGAFDVKRFLITLTLASPPVANPDHYQVMLNDTLTVPAAGMPVVLANDVDPNGGALTAAKLTDPDKGTLSAFNADGSFTYQAPASSGPAFQPTVKWHTTGTYNTSAALVAPVLGNGVPYVIESDINTVFALSGVDGSLLWRVTGAPAPYNCTIGGYLAGDDVFPAAVGDIDDSGQLAIVFPTECTQDVGGAGNPARYIALNAKDGSVKWLSPPLSPYLKDITTNQKVPLGSPNAAPDSLCPRNSTDDRAPESRANTEHPDRAG